MIRRKYLILLSIAGLIVALDQLTKNLIVSAFREGASLPVFSNWFSITRVHNTGAAFGLLAGLHPGWREPFFFLVPVLTLLAILFIFARLREDQSVSVYALAMIVGGALGNLADRIRLGYVIDFLDTHWQNHWHFPAFNLADSGITIGVFLLVLGMLRDKEDTVEAARGA
jgi:signal peptidase II